MSHPPGTTRPAGRLLVTGTSGIAAAVVRAASAGGWVVHALGNDTEQVARLGRETDASVTEVDLRDDAAAERAVAGAVERLGGLDAFVAVAGGSGRRFGDGPMHDATPAAWRETFDLNLFTAIWPMSTAVRTMLGNPPGDMGRGAVVLTSSVLATSPSPRRFATHAYAAAKAAINGLVTTTSAYYAEHGIRINAVAPGLVDTPMATRAGADPEILRFATDKQPLAGGMLDVADIAAAVLFLIGPDSARITGQTLAVDGGWSVRGDSA